MQVFTIEVIELLRKTCTNETLAAITAALLSCEYDDSLTEREAEIGQVLFDTLCDDADVVTLAQGR